MRMMTMMMIMTMMIVLISVIESLFELTVVVCGRESEMGTACESELKSVPKR